MIRGALVALLALAGCSTPAPTYRDMEEISRNYERSGTSPLAPHEQPAAADACGAVANHARIGTPIADWTPPAGARVIHPGQAVTDDLRRERLNVLVDANGRITALECY